MFGDLKYRLLGSVAAFGADGPIRLGGPKQRTVLAALLLNANQVVSEDQLVDLLWEERPPASARGQLQVRVWELRNLLGRSAIVRRVPGYQIEIKPGELDIDLFDDMVRDAQDLIDRGDQRGGVERLRLGLELWQGPPLGGVTDALMRRSGPVLSERRRAVLETLFDAELASGRHMQVVRELLAVVEEYPFGERLQEQLMLALQRSGRVPEALEVYTTARHRLDAELGVEPGERLQAVHRQVLGSVLDDAAEREPVAPATGAVRLTRPAELPRDVPRFVGRTDHLARLNAQLAARVGTHPDVWVLHGIAGVGKTALALHWAHQVRDRFPDGQLYVDLGGFDVDCEPLRPAQALSQMLHALGVDPRRIPDEVDARAGLYRSLLADRQVLLMLDGARDAEQVLPLLPPTGTVLVTSRHRLGRLVGEAGALSLALTPMSAAESRTLLGTVLGQARVDAEPEAADGLVRLCGHLPLALRIAASNIATSPDNTIAEMVADLAEGDRLTALVLDGVDESGVTRAFAASYEALTPELRRLFRLLGLVTCADFTAYGAAALTGDPVETVTRQLRRLAATHLIEQHAAGRFRLHDLVRIYALRQAVAHEPAQSRAQAWRRFVELHLSAAESAERAFGRGPRLPCEPDATPGRRVCFGDSAAAAAWIDAEHENLAAIVAQAVTEGPYPLAWHLADALCGPFNHRGLRLEWVEVATRVVAAARRLDEPAVEAASRLSIGRAGRSEEAGAFLERALDLQRRSGSRQGEMAVLVHLGTVYRHRGLLGESLASLECAREIAVGEGCPLGEAAALVGLGLLHRLRGNGESARRSLDRAAELHRELSYPYGEACALNGLSRLDHDRGEHGQARERAEQALRIARHEQNRETEVGALDAVARAEAALGDVGRAARLQEEAVVVALEWGSRWHIAEALCGMAEIHVVRGEHARALAVGEEALGLARTGRFRLIEVRCLMALARAYAGQGRPGDARRSCAESAELSAASGLTLTERQARELLALL